MLCATDDCFSPKVPGLCAWPDPGFAMERGKLSKAPRRSITEGAIKDRGTGGPKVEVHGMASALVKGYRKVGVPCLRKFKK